MIFEPGRWRLSPRPSGPKIELICPSSGKSVLRGISLFLVLLTAFLTPVAMLASWKSVDLRVQGFYICLLALETGGVMVGDRVDIEAEIEAVQQVEAQVA